jgi:cathepsin L
MESYFTNRTKVRGYADVPYGREDLLKKAVALYGPVAVGMDASQWGFTNYQGGIYSDKKCSSVDMNHAVIVVGYGTENGRDYWLARNRYVIWLSCFFYNHLRFT